MFFFYKVYYGIRTAQINELINCVFKQSEMRNHLLRSLEEKFLSMFPVEKIGVHCINCIEIFCSCRMPMEGKMIECSECKEWYHLACGMDVPKRAVHR